MNVSELARRVGVAPSAVRFYERKGVLRRPARADNGYRRYGDDDVCHVQLVVGLRRLGLELAVAGRLAALCQTGQCDVMARDLLPLVSAERVEIARRRADLEALDRRLEELEADLARDGADADLCLGKGGDVDDLPVRLRAGLSVSADPRLPVLNGR